MIDRNGDWRSYPRDRKILKKTGFVVIMPKEMDTIIPLSCPICFHVLRTRDDESSYLGFGCCHRCEMIWAAPRRAEWRDGWRPSPDDVKRQECERLPIVTTLDVD